MPAIPPSILPEDFDESELDEEASTLLNEAYSAIGRQPELAQNPEWVYNFAHRLGLTPSFLWLRSRYISSGNASSGADGVAGRWMVLAIAAGVEQAQLYPRFKEAVKANQGCSWLIHPLRGLRVDQRYELAPDAFVCPAFEVPDNPPKRALFADPRDGPEIPTCAAALVLTRTHRRLFPSEEEAPESERYVQPEMNRKAHAIRLALGLASFSPLEQSGSYVTNAPGDWLTTPGHGYSGIRGNYMGGDFEPNIQKARELLPLLDAFDGRESLDLAIDRLLRSRLDKPLEDKIIDLGLATEIVLMHGPSGGNGEITNKVSTRAGWLVGGGVNARILVSSLVTKLYGVRSTVVHSGRADPKHEASLAEFDALVRDVMIAILRLGKFPDWKRLVMGDLAEIPKHPVRP